MITRFIFGSVFVAIALIIFVFAFGWKSIDNSLPQYEGTSPVHLVKHPVDIYRDSFAIAHIYTQTDEDAYYGLGYVHASERMFQMDMARRVGNGTLSEVIGEKTLPVDRWALTIGFRKIALWMWNAASSETRKYLAAYTNGVNDYIASHHGKFGFEFNGLHYEPAAWKPQDCMVIGRLMSWEMNFAFWNDAAFSDIAMHIDSAHLASLIPGYPQGAPTVLGDEHFAAPTIHTMDSVLLKPQPISDATSSFQTFFRSLAQTPFGGSQAGGGSNTVALAASRSASKAPMLENDMHLVLGAPARWFIAHLHSATGLNVAGFTIPGLPVILSGRNENISWGITNGMIDESDFFSLHLDSNGTVYHTPYGTKKITSTKEVISIRTNDDANPTRYDTLDVRTTDLGPIVSSLHTFNLAKVFSNSPNKPISDAYHNEINSSSAIAVEWNGYFALGDEFGCLFKLHHARTTSDAITDMSDFATPCLNFSVVSAKGGQIAYKLIGRISIRNGGEERVLLPRNAGVASDQWQGFSTTTNLPRLDDPPNGYIISANNPATAYRSIPYGENWEPAERAERLVQLVTASKKIDVKGLTSIVRDVSSPFEYSELRPSILRLYRGEHPDSAAKKHIVMNTALDYLEHWDGVQDSLDISTTILNVYLTRLLVNTFWDELGDGLFNEFCYVNNVPVRTIARLLADPSNIWWDDVRSPQRETRDDIIRRSFEQTIEWLTKRFGSDVRRWNWGKLHSLTYKNPAGDAGHEVAALVNINSGPNPGSLTTVAQSSYSFWSPFIATVGPSMRMIADMSKQSVYVSLPTGNSGNTFSPHYRDMVTMFKQGEFVELPLNSISPSWKKLTLKPE
ncbi:MAG TPA: penicillin acylase family protein [Candidatus Kapabacteria bacterium]|nr:penicillin acylase family protein [Candidatus Kapabacteria bacterium]